jgi:hypothetical protein
MNRKSYVKKKILKVFFSLEEENDDEHRRLAKMSPGMRLQEFAALQERVWGRKWTHDPMVRTVKIEKIKW